MKRGNKSSVVEALVGLKTWVTSLQVDIHMDGELVESFSETGPDASEQEAPPTSAEDFQDKGELFPTCEHTNTHMVN